MFGLFNGRSRRPLMAPIALPAAVLAAILFVAVNIWAGGAFRSARLDLTEDGIFSVSDATREVLANIQEPVRLRFYMSESLRDLGPVFLNYGRRVSDLLDEYARIADGRLILERYDPKPYSPEEDLAVADGIRGLRTDGAGAQIYFGVAGSNSTDDLRSIPYLAAERNDFLEYELTRLIYDLAQPEKRVVGVLGALPLNGTQADGFRPWVAFQTLSEGFELRVIEGAPGRIDDDVDILLLAQPQDLGEAALYAIDQFVMRGGRLLAFVDPLVEVMQAEVQLTAAAGNSVITDLAPLLRAWGVDMPADRIVGDRQAAMRVQAMHNGAVVLTNYLPWLDLGEDNRDAFDVVTANLRRITMQSAGFIEPLPGAATTIQPLLTSSGDAAVIDVQKLRQWPDPVALLQEFDSAGRSFVLAARVTGPVASAFAGGPPAGVTDAAMRAAHRAQAETPLNLILVADADILADANWTEMQPVLGQAFVVPTANNGDFAINALDNLSGSAGLITLRGRGFKPRPFKIIETMKREAEAKYRNTEETLVSELAATNADLLRLQQNAQSGGIALTAEQQKSVEQFRGRMLDLRRQLREVQFALGKDVDDLGRRLKLINIWAMPAVVSVIALLLALLHSRRAERRRPGAGAAP